MNTTDSNSPQIDQCQRPFRKRIAARAAGITSRLTAGESTVFCAVCQRWQWPDELCPLAVVGEAVTPAPGASAAAWW